MLTEQAWKPLSGTSRYCGPRSLSQAVLIFASSSQTGILTKTLKVTQPRSPALGQETGTAAARPRKRRTASSPVRLREPAASPGERRSAWTELTGGTTERSTSLDATAALLCRGRKPWRWPARPASARRGPPSRFPALSHRHGSSEPSASRCRQPPDRR